MRTLFEDVNEKSDREDDGSTKSLPMVTWLIALLMIALAVGAYFWVSRRQQQQAQQQIAVPVSLEDDRQVNQTILKFGSFIVAGRWDEAEQMLSGEAKARLEQEKKKLRESFMAARLEKKKDDKVAQMFPLTIASRTPSTVRADSAIVFADGEQSVVAITVVKEGDRLLINSW
jgi:hypothetical protein